MTEDPSEDKSIPSELLAAVRDHVAEQEQATLVEFRATTPGHVDVVVEEREADGGHQQYLYRVSWEPDIEGGGHLHWEELGEVAPGEE